MSCIRIVSKGEC